MITLITETAAEKKAASPAPPHFKNLFSALQIRRLDRASSAAVVMDIAGPSNSSMVHSSTIISGERQLQVLEHAGKADESDATHPRYAKPAMPMRVVTGAIRTDLDVGRSSYNCN